jgi:hypothetical protein
MLEGPVPDPLNIGIDFGSTVLRVAYVLNGNVPEVMDERSFDRHWLFCEPPPEGGFGVVFPSLKEKIGISTKVLLDGSEHRPTEVITEVFRQLKKTVQDRTSRQVSQCVISVPARYAASQRAALREAGLGAGFADVHLINDSIAAVLSYRNNETAAATIMVYSMGYSGFELGLVRAARGHFRALAYEGGSSPTGSSFDRMFLEGWISTVSNRFRLDRVSFDTSIWAQIRFDAQRVKEALSSKQEADFPVSLQTPDGQVRANVVFSRKVFEEAVVPQIRSTLELHHGLLEQANLQMNEVDDLLLVGGSTRIPILQVLVEQTMRKPVLLSPDSLARGAAVYAAGLEFKPLSSVLEGQRVSAEAAQVIGPAIGSPLRGSLVVDENGVSSGQQLVLIADAQPKRTELGETALQFLERARELMEGGERDQVRQILEETIGKAQSLLKKITSEQPQPSRAVSRALSAMAMARKLVKQGRFEEAVRQSHLAWKQDPDSPDVFEEMIEIHCKVAMANDQLSGYQDAQRWLMCAYGHDQSNNRIRELLAQRHFLQAEELRKNGQRNEALQVLERCLTWNPEHKQGKEMRSSMER